MIAKSGDPQVDLPGEFVESIAYSNRKREGLEIGCTSLTLARAEF
jgi:hypothetical protein